MKLFAPILRVLGAAADLLGWHWLGDKCAAWIGQEPDPEA